MVDNVALSWNQTAAALLILAGVCGPNYTGFVLKEIIAWIAELAVSVLVVGVTVGGLDYALSVDEGPSAVAALN